MLIELLITFRETFEAVLIIGIIFSYLKKINHFDKKKYVISGAISGLILSILGAILFQLLLGGFEGQVEESFEGIMMIIGAIMITTLIIWLHRHRARGFKAPGEAQRPILAATNFHFKG